MRKAYSNSIPSARQAGLDPLRFAVGHGVRVEEEAADERRLAVVDVPHDDKVEMVGRRRRRRLAGLGAGGRGCVLRQGGF